MSAAKHAIDAVLAAGLTPLLKRTEHTDRVALGGSVADAVEQLALPWLAQRSTLSAVEQLHPS